MNKIFVKTLKTLLWDFLSPASQADLNLFSKTVIHPFSYFMMWNFMVQKIEKNYDPEILHCRQMENRIKSNW